MLQRLNARSAIIHERFEISLKQVLPPLAQGTEYRPPVHEGACPDVDTHCLAAQSDVLAEQIAPTQIYARPRQRNELGRHCTRFCKNRVHMVKSD